MPGLQVQLHQPPAQEKKGPAGDTGVDVGLERAVCTLVACDSANLQHHGRLFSAKRNRDGLRFYIWNEGSGEFLFRASGRHPKVSTSDRSAVTKPTRVSNASYHQAVVASDVLLDSELSDKRSSIGHGRHFTTPFGRISNHHSSVSDSPDMLNGGRLLVGRTFFCTTACAVASSKLELPGARGVDGVLSS